MQILSKRNTWFILIFFVLLFILIPYFKLFTKEKKEIVLDGKKILLFLAKTEKDRIRGLQYIIWLPKNTGMLFIFDKKDKYCFWNKNTFIRLKLFFLKNNKILEEYTLNPIWKERQTVCPENEIDCVIELKE